MRLLAMSRHPLARLLALVGALAWGTTALAAGDAEVAFGSTVKNLTFKDIRCLTRTLDDLPRSKAYVLVGTTTTCPLVQRYLPVLSRLEKAYRDRGVQFIALNVGADDTIRAMAEQALEHDVEFPFVKDYDARCAAALGMKRTPEVAILDGERKLRYRGRIDDQYRLGGDRAKPMRQDLKEAIDAILAGKSVAVRETPTDGCIITRVESAPAKEAVTFADHVAPIVRKSCAGCHRPGTAAPFSLTTFEEVAARANTIAEVVRDERMPPWYGAARHTEINNSRALSSSEKEVLFEWIQGGKAKGDLSKLPPPPPRDDNRWKIGQPDLILKAPEHSLPAEGVIDYKYAILTHLFTQDTWIKGAQILPGNPKTVHHCNMAYYKFGEPFRRSNFVTGVVPGSEPMLLDDRIAFRIPAGSMLALEIHYVPTGKKEKCRISVGLKYANGAIDKSLKHFLLEDRSFAIPPGAPAHKVAFSRTLTHDAIGVGMFCHMHLRGRDMAFKAHYPDGKSETLLLIPNYNFNWQMAYTWAPGKKKLPKGTRLEAIAHYDNSAFNPFNPDPKATVREGRQTFHEMMNGFVFFVDTGEKLGLDIDGKTGRPRSKPAVKEPKPR
jgi:thiol-disulfide isomerase/thioredoxin